MGAPKPSQGGRGPLGADTNRPRPDKGTLKRQRSKSPAEIKGEADQLAEQRESKRDQYLLLARSASFAMQGRSAKQSLMAFGHGVGQWLHENTGSPAPAGKPARVQSYLGGKFLRMYLDGKVDDDIIADAGAEIGESVEFKALSADVQANLQSAVTSQHLSTLAPDRVLTLVAKRLEAKRKSKAGIAFRNTLNTVIGGVTGADVDSVRIASEKAGDKGIDRTYTIGITFYDVYDFENKRTGEYDVYRKKLAALLRADRFDDFEKAFGVETGLVDGHRTTKLDDAAVFASFMYALEKKGWTPGGLAWKVTVPVDITLHFAAPPQQKKPR